MGLTFMKVISPPPRGTEFRPERVDSADELSPPGARLALRQSFGEALGLLRELVGDGLPFVARACPLRSRARSQGPRACATHHGQWLAAFSVISEQRDMR